jgi:hypothetical protein
MQGKVEKFMLVSISHVNKYGTNWGDFVDYAFMIHHAMPHTVTKFRPFYLLHAREMRLSNRDLSVRMDDEVTDFILGNPVGTIIRTLADRLKEAHDSLRAILRYWHQKASRQMGQKYSRRGGLSREILVISLLQIYTYVNYTHFCLFNHLRTITKEWKQRFPFPGKALGIVTVQFIVPVTANCMHFVRTNISLFILGEL